MTTPPVADAPAPDSGAGEAELSALIADLKAADRLIAKAVRRDGQLAGSGVAERVEGGSLDWTLSMACRMTGTDARHLVAAGEMLLSLPTVDRLFAEQILSWGQVRRITQAARRLTVAQRAVLDARVAAAVDAYDGIDAFDPDHLCDAVDAAAEQLRDARSVQRQEAAAARANFLAIQGRIDGGATIYASGDAVGVAPILNAIDAARPIPAANSNDAGDADTPTSQAQQRFLALRDICGDYLTGNNDTDADGSDGHRAQGADTNADRADGGDGAGGGDGPGGGRDGASGDGVGGDDGADDGGREPLNPSALAGPVPGGRRRRRGSYLFTVGVDLSQFTITPHGTIELNVPGAVPTVSAAVVELLARDADFQAVIFDGKRPLAVTRKIHANDIPADIRAAVRARDGGDRWPGSRAPISWTEPHHIRWRRDGGTHDPDNLASFTRRNHRKAHSEDRWHIKLIPHTGELRITRRGRTWRSLPKTTGLPPPPEQPPPEPLTQQQPGENPTPGTLPF